MKTPRATKEQNITVKGENVIKINNVLIGEVWLCTGQSNMEFQVVKDKGWKTGMLNEEEEMKDADYPEIRLFQVQHQLSPEGPKDDCVGHWVVCNPTNLKEFSAVGFVFGRKLYKSLNVPVGLIQSTWGGTHDAPALFQYITRCQSFLQMGKPDNDFLVYLPVYDMWNDVNGRLLQFDIHKMDKNAPKFIETVHKINQSGYDVDYISDNFIRNTKCVDGMLLTKGGVKYKAIIIPAVKKMPDDVLAHLISLAEQGAKIIFIENYPLDVPGFSKLEQRRSHFKNLLSLLPVAPDFKETACFANPVSMIDAIKNYCVKTNQAVPETFGEITRCIFESLALRYRQVLESLQKMSTYPIEKLHVSLKIKRQERYISHLKMCLLQLMLKLKVNIMIGIIQMV